MSDKKDKNGKDGNVLDLEKLMKSKQGDSSMMEAEPREYDNYVIEYYVGTDIEKHEDEGDLVLTPSIVAISREPNERNPQGEVLFAIPTDSLIHVYRRPPADETAH